MSKYLLQLRASCTIFNRQDNLFPSTNINFQHMELSVKRPSLLFLLLLTLLSPSPLSARILPQQRAAKPTTATSAPAPAPARLPEAKIFSQLLSNDLEVSVLEDHSSPLVTIELAVKNGSYPQPPELNGLSHLYEH